MTDFYGVTIARKNEGAIKSISFNNVDLYYIELDGIKIQNDLQAKIDGLENELAGIVGNEYFALNLYGSAFTKENVDALINIICRNRARLKKLAIVGADLRTRLYFTRKFKEKANTAFSFNNDYQKAKEWLVSIKQS